MLIFAPLRIKKLIMRKISLLIYVLLVAILPLTVGCEPIDQNNPPKLVLDTYELNVDGGGGDIALFYSLRNGVKGGEFEIVTAVSWIALKEVTENTIVLRIDASNIDEERFASVTIKYPGLDPAVRVSVLQDKQLLNKYKFEASNITHTSCTIKYIPLDKSMPYMANVIDAEYFKQSGVSDMNVFIETEMATYRTLAERNKMTLEELMGRVSPQLIYKGDAVREFTGMKPGSTYIAYSYGITFHGNEYTLLTPMHQKSIEIPMPSMYTVSFGLSSQSSGSMAIFTIDPKDWTGYYNVQIAPEDSIYYLEPGMNMSDGFVKGIASSFYDKARKAMAGGATAEQFLQSSCYKGVRQLNVPVEAGKRYMLIVFAVESDNGSVPVMRSMPSTLYI